MSEQDPDACFVEGATAMAAELQQVIRQVNDMAGTLCDTPLRISAGHVLHCLGLAIRITRALELTQQIAIYLAPLPPMEPEGAAEGDGRTIDLSCFFTGDDPGEVFEPELAPKKKLPSINLPWTIDDKLQ